MPNRLSHRSPARQVWIWWGLALLWAGFAFPSGAQDLVLHLRNGDRITGRLLSESTNAIVLTTAFAEKVAIEKALVERREKVAPPPVTAPATPTPPPQPPTAATNAQVSVSPAKAATQPPAPAVKPVPQPAATNKTTVAPPATLAKPAEPKPPEPSAFRRFLSEWRGEAQLGANFGLGTKDRQTFTGHIKMTHNNKFEGSDRVMRNIVEYNLWYGETDHVVSDNRMEGSWTTEYDLSKRFLVYNAFRAGYDEVRKIDVQYELGPGLGYKWVTRTNFVFKNEIGGNYQEQFHANGDRVNRYSLRLAEDFWWQVTKRLRWDEKLEFFPEIQDFGDYRIRFESNLSYLLRDNLTITLNIIDIYDTAVPPTVSKNDLQIRSLLGLKF